MKYKIFTATALAGGTFAALFGGWDKALQTLVIFMIVDWITGGILLPVVFGRRMPPVIQSTIIKITYFFCR